MVEAWGHPAAAIDLDQLHLNVDARWELPYDTRRNAMVLEQATQLAISLFEHGWRTVMMCGNSLFDPADTSPILATLCLMAEIYHITLTPQLNTVLSRCAASSSRDASRLREDFQLHADKAHPGSARLDNTNMTAEQALAALAGMVGGGAGRMHCSHHG